MAAWDDIAVVVLGLTAIAYALQNAWVFARIGKKLARAFALNLCGEAAAGALTLAFGTAQMTGLMHELTPTQQNLMRLVILISLVVPSVNLKRIIWKIEHEP